METGVAIGHVRRLATALPRGFFQALDASGGGYLSREELRQGVALFNRAGRLIAAAGTGLRPNVLQLRTMRSQQSVAARGLGHPGPRGARGPQRLPDR